MKKPVFCFYCLLFPFLMLSNSNTVFSQSVLIRDVTLIDGTGADPLSGVSVLVDQGRFLEITQSRIKPDDDILVVDGSNKFLIPGIIDSHIHLPGGRTGPKNSEMIMDLDTGKKILESYLYSGVTAVYDSGNNAEYIYEIRDQERNGIILSPRIFATVSLIAPPEGHGCCAGGTVVSSYDDALEKLDKLFKMKPDMLKFTRERRGMGLKSRNMPLIEKTLMKKLVDYAHENGIRTTVHVSEVEMAQEAIEAGADAFAHTIYLDDASLDFINTVSENGIILSTTMSRIEADSSFLEESLYIEAVEDEILSEIKSSERFGVYQGGGAGSPLSGWLRSLRPAIMKNFKQLHEGGVLLAMGTDRTIGPISHQELRLLVEAGISPLDVIRIGTLNSATYIGVEKYLGSIEEGKLADMILLNADPTADIGNTKMIDLVFKGGAIIDRSSLDVPANRN